MERKIALGENIRRNREMLGMTQRQLAEYIGYTEKSISKWEKGGGMPDLNVTAQLADIFRVTVDELLFEETTAHYFLGVDGGGTKTLFCLADETGKVIRSIRKGPSNPNDIGMENTMALLREGIREACSGIPYGRISLFAGIAGGGFTGNHAQTLHHFLEQFGFYAFANGSDVENQMALADYSQCVLVIMGTGFIAYAMNGENFTRVAGWGQLFDEGGCGYTLGRDGIYAALRAGDGSGEHTLIASLIEERTGESAERHLASFYAGGKAYIASFQEIVFRAAEKGDHAAGEILDKNMAFAARIIDTAAKAIPGDGIIPVYMAGGISERKGTIFPLIEKHLKEKRCRLIKMEK